MFNLPKSEKVFDDFSCAHGTMPGRMFLTENFLCFYSTLLGKTSKFILRFDQVTKVYKTNNKFTKAITVHAGGLAVGGSIARNTENTAVANPDQSSGRPRLLTTVVDRARDNLSLAGSPGVG